MKDLCLHAVDVARQAGITYADARFVAIRNQSLATEDERVSGLSDAESAGVGIRVLAGGAWGFAATSELNRDAVARAAGQAVAIARANHGLRNPQGVQWAPEPSHEGVFRTPTSQDPFAVSLEKKLSLLLAINGEVCAVKGVKKCHSHMRFRRQHRFLANSEGTCIESDVLTSTARYTATAVDDQGAKTRYFEAPGANAGYEHIDNTPLLAEAQRVGEEAVAQLSAKPCPIGEIDLILHPSHLALTMHESIGHATELDRVLGMEESLAGSSFATLDKRGTLHYGSPIMNIVADNALPGGLATMGWDDDGVPGQQWHLIKDGILVDYQTDRETCHAIGAKRSHGSCRADSWASIPIVRQSNFGLEAGREPLTPEELIADTQHGIYIEGMGSFSIDQKRQNFQFGGDCFWEIRNGKIVGMLKDVTYQAITTDFWGALDAICDQRFWQSVGVMNCGKGDPMQIAQMSHSSAPCRLRKIRVGGAK
mgnify:CR=1 FL=1